MGRRIGRYCRPSWTHTHACPLSAVTQYKRRPSHLLARDAPSLLKTPLLDMHSQLSSSEPRTIYADGIYFTPCKITNGIYINAANESPKDRQGFFNRLQ